MAERKRGCAVITMRRYGVLLHSFLDPCLRQVPLASGDSKVNASFQREPCGLAVKQPWDAYNPISSHEYNTDAQSNQRSRYCAQTSAPSVRFAANDVRLSPRQWLVAALLIVFFFWLIPQLWMLAKPLTISADYRLPYRLGNDYWSYQQTARQTCASDATLLVGDSVLWGHYVDCDGTLSYHLDQQAEDHRFANLAVDGIHPVALSGLVKYFGSAIHDKRVIINCNLLWISSPRHDLSSDKEAAFNHPTLVPQFVPQIPCYRASVSDRLGIAIGRRVGILNWADHLRIAYYDNDDLPTWTLESP